MVHITMGNRSMCAQENHQFIHFMIHLYRSDAWSPEYYDTLRHTFIIIPCIRTLYASHHEDLAVTEEGWAG